MQKEPKRSPRQDARALDARLAMLCSGPAGPSLLPWGHLGQTSLPFTPRTPGQGPGDAGTDRAGGLEVGAGRGITELRGQHSEDQG